MPKVYSEGFHGTSLSRAEEIHANGFDDDTGNPICFATPDSPEIAHEFGSMHAREDNESSYGVIHASFPPTEAELWPIPLQVRIPAERAAEIFVTAVIAFDVADSGLYLPADAQKPQIPNSYLKPAPTSIQY